MKKIIIFCLTVTMFFSSLNAGNFLTSRIFDFTVGADVALSNNVTALSNILVKDLVIDLNKINERVPDSGANLSMKFNPDLQMRLSLGKLKFGVKTGIEMQGQFTISKDLFEFLGKGNQIGDEIEVGVDCDFDAFYFLDLAMGWHSSKLKINVVPSLFQPIISANGDLATLKVLNDDAGKVSLGLTSNYNIYTPLDLQNIDVNDLSTSAIGFDLAGSVEFPLNSRTNIKIAARVPIIPGTLTKKMVYTNTIYYETSLETMDNPEQVSESSFESGIDTEYKINRPLKLIGYIDYSILGGLLDLNGGLGLGCRHPFVSNAKIYPEYYLAGTLNLINLFKVSLSMEYTDQVFINQLTADFNIRFFELYTGISLQSSSFWQSFTTAGFGAFVYLTFGF